MAPRVTALVAEPRHRVRVDLDGEPWRSLPTAAVAGAGLRVGTELDRARARKVRRELRRVDAVAIATAALARAEHSTAGLDAKLERRGIVLQERIRTLDRLQRAGYVNDARFAAARAATLAERDCGDEAIRFDLEQKGIGPSEIASALASLAGETARARTLVQRIGRSPKSARRLAAKGFSQESIESAIGEAEGMDGEECPAVEPDD